MIMTKQVKKKSQKQENQVAFDLGGKVTIASGALYFQKADVRTDKYLVECKYTDKGFYSLTTKTWEKIRSEAIKDGLRIPVMQIDLYGGVHSFAVMDINDFEAEFEESNYSSFLEDTIETSNKSFRITGEIVSKSLSVEQIHYTMVHVGKHTLAVLLWDDMILLNN